MLMPDRTTVQQAPTFKPETLALVGGSIALVAVVIFTKKYRKKRKRK